MLRFFNEKNSHYWFTQREKAKKIRNMAYYEIFLPAFKIFNSASKWIIIKIMTKILYFLGKILY